jgi:hypothetical protein
VNHETVTSTQRRVGPRWIAFATKHLADTGGITQWSRWHLAPNLTNGERTLCGKLIPKAILRTRRPDADVAGGDCGACRRANIAISDGANVE